MEEENGDDYYVQSIILQTGECSPVPHINEPICPRIGYRILFFSAVFRLPPPAWWPIFLSFPFGTTTPRPGALDREYFIFIFYLF